MQAEALASKDLTQLWDSAMAHLKRISEAHGVLFMNARPSWEAPGEVLAISFNPDNRFAFIAAQKDEAKAAVKEAFAKAGAPNLRFIVRQADAAQEPSSAVETAAAPAAAAPVREAAPSPVRDMAPATAAAAAEAASPIAGASEAQAFVPVVSAEPQAAPEAPEYEEVPYEELMGSSPAPSFDDADSSGADDLAAAPGDEAGSGDLNDILANAFGTDVKFTEVE